MNDPAGSRASDDDEPFVPTGKWANPAIYASNWKTILVIDAMIGLTITWVGLLMILFWNWFLGSFIAAIGMTYMVAVVRRYLQWRWLRTRAGLD